jgi:hypothetical protein
MGWISRDSRYQFVEQETDSDGRLVLRDREPYRYRKRTDNIVIVAATGDTWDTIAHRLYEDISDRAAGLFWIGLDYQPTPVVDPTVPIRPGTVLHWPAPIVVVEEILGREPVVYR